MIIPTESLRSMIARDIMRKEVEHREKVRKQKEEIREQRLKYFSTCKLSRKLEMIYENQLRILDRE